jgi:drug/metabolite transporter (DMT)-like permease
MENPTSKYQLSVLALRWTARIWSVVTIALVLAFIVGERSLPSLPKEWLGFLFFPFGICVGMIVAWKKESLGGSITVGSLLAAYVVHFAAAGALLKGWAWLAFAAPGFLFLVSSHLSETHVAPTSRRTAS